MAILLKGLQAHHSRFVIEVLDQVFEDIILGLEVNKLHQISSCLTFF
jgi:hypothetical protein